MGHRLNLASGTDVKDGWVNLDVVPRWKMAPRGCDVVWDARKDKIPFPDGSADEVYAGYLLLHLAPHFHKPVLADVRRVLSDAGVLVIGEVDMDKVLRRFLETPSDPRLSELIWGEQGSVHGEDLAEFDKHCQGFTQGSLEKVLSESGFGGFRKINVHCAEVWYELTLECRKA